MALTDNIVARWSLDEASGNRVDTIGGIILTSVNSVGQATGKVGATPLAATFLGTNQALRAPNSAAVQFGNADWTVSLWAYLPNAGVSSTEYIFSKRSANFGGEIEIGRFQNRVDCKLYTSAGGNTVLATASVDGVASTAGWYFICARHVAATKTLTLVVNANATSTNYSGTADTSAYRLFIGAGSSGPAGSESVNGILAGKIDDVVKWSRALGNDEIIGIYNAGTGIEYPFTTWTGSLSLRSGLKILTPAAT